MRWNPLQTIGTGVGIEIRGADLAVAVVRSRWAGVTVLASTTIHNFRARPAVEWGREYEEFLQAHRLGELPATVALPRPEVIVRLLSLPAAAGAELASAVEFQIDSLHPYGEDSVYFGYAPLERPAAPGADAAGLPVAVVIAAREVVEGYADLFAEAGVRLRGMTVAAAGFYGASRLLRRRTPEPFLLADRFNGRFEFYGESATRPLLSAAFEAATMPFERAIAVAAAELRLPEDAPLPLVVSGEGEENPPALPAEQVLGSPLQSPASFDLKRDATAFVTALAAACPRWGWHLNLLPKARRAVSARWPLVATGVAATVFLAAGLLLWLRGPLQDRHYAQALEREIRRLETVEREVRGLERQTERAGARRRQLESLRRRPEADLALVTEVSRRLPSAVWLSTIEVNDNSAQLSGQADSAAPLLGLLDNSGVLTEAAFAASLTRNENREIFRIRATRKDRLPPPSAPAMAVPGAAAPPAAAPVAPSPAAAPVPPGHNAH